MPTERSTLPFVRFFIADPRHYQIAVLFSLLIYGAGWLAFDVNGRQIFVLLGSVLMVQYFCTGFFTAPSFDPRSALISGLSLCADGTPHEPRRRNAGE